MSKTYTYFLSSFPNQKVNRDALAAEINLHPEIQTQLLLVRFGETGANQCDVVFAAGLPADEKFVLDGSTGQPVNPSPGPQTIIGSHLGDALHEEVTEMTYHASGRLELETTWRDAAKTIKAEETIYTYKGNALTQTQTTIYDKLGQAMSVKTLDYSEESLPSGGKKIIARRS